MMTRLTLAAAIRYNNRRGKLRADDQWAQEVAAITLIHGTSRFILIGEDGAIEVFAGEVAPAVHEIVATERRARAQ